MRILIVGNLGMLGTDLMSAFGVNHNVLGMDQEELDITEASQCAERANEIHPDVIINAAALTQVDYCETHEEEAFQINGEGAGNLAKAAASVHSLLVHYSTDYVFDGLKSEAYCEEDEPKPLSIYGKSKLRGEELVRLHCPDHLILRTSWLFGSNKNNFIRTIVSAARDGRSLRVVNDQKGSPSYSKDVACYTARLIQAGRRRTYHLTNSGSCTWYELAVRSLEWAGIEGTQVLPVTTAEFPRPATRPTNSILANVRLAQERFPLMRPWQDAVREYAKLL